jgi:hypothetical protein
LIAFIVPPFVALYKSMLEFLRVPNIRELRAS